ncbi:uncharacterized protein LOC129760265, partial [Uranotaenia lowii]|uniref:uncharacterized protein LOC129760265 n=1 Tax=Uranotaenia lowii TaxID=190385 RepID=UPI00247B1E95
KRLSLNFPGQSESIDNEEENSLSAIQVEVRNSDLLQLVPHVVEQLRLGHVSAAEYTVLEEIFEELWPLMVEEAKRLNHQEQRRSTNNNGVVKQSGKIPETSQSLS